MADSAIAKLKRAETRIRELEGFVRRKPPFIYMLESNYQTGERATYAKQNPEAVEEAALLCGEVVQNLRSALDHAYWDIVSPFANTPREQRSVQFPFCEKADRLEEAIKNRLGHRVSDEFYQAVFDLKPYGEGGGNVSLYSVDLLNNPEKHRDLTPVGDFTEIHGPTLRQQIPGFPSGIDNMAFGMNFRDISWSFCAPQGGAASIVESRLKVPVSLILPITLSRGERTSATDALRQFHQAVNIAIEKIRKAAP